MRTDGDLETWVLLQKGLERSWEESDRIAHQKLVDSMKYSESEQRRVNMLHWVFEHPNQPMPEELYL